MPGLFGGAAAVLFNAVHFELAWIYRDISITTPLAINNLEMEPEDEEKNKRKHDLLMRANIICCLMYGVTNIVSNIFYLNCVNYGGTSCSLSNITWVIYLAFTTLMYALQIVSGVYLISSLQDIRFFFVDSKATDYLDTKQMLIHAFAFGLYLVAAVIYLPIYLCYQFNDTWAN
jgi:hypothetical protein